MVSAKDVLDIARSQIGVVESPANSNKTPYGAWYGWNGVAWCAIFISWCFDRAGKRMPAIQSEKGAAYCPYIVNYYRQIGRFDKTPKVGSLAMFDWQGDGISDHIGIVEEVIGGGQFIAIEGNTSHGNNSNGGKVMRRTRYIKQVQGFAHPEYDGDNPAPVWSGTFLKRKKPLMYSNEIMQVQHRLLEKGYWLGDAGADGYFGNDTAYAVGRFQEDNGLKKDQIVGRNTWNKLFS